MPEAVIAAFFPSLADAEGAAASLRSMDSCAAIVQGLQPRRDAALTITLRTRALEGLAAGALLGGFVGAVLGATAADGVLLAPGVGVVLAGPGSAALATSTAVALVGAALGAMAGSRARVCEARTVSDPSRGGVVVVARCTLESARAARTALEAHGGIRFDP